MTKCKGRPAIAALSKDAPVLTIKGTRMNPHVRMLANETRA